MNSVFLVDCSRLIFHFPPMWIVEIETFVAVGCYLHFCEACQRCDFLFLICRIYSGEHFPSKLGLRAFYCFKHRIEPKWEHPICANGGKWTVTFTYSHSKCDNFWIETVCFNLSLLNTCLNFFSILTVFILWFFFGFISDACDDRWTILLWRWNLWGSCEW